MIRKLIEAGVNIFRINMSHAQHDQVRIAVDSIRSISHELVTRVGIMMDSRGPEIRTGDITKDLNLEFGQSIGLMVRDESRRRNTVWT